MSISLGEERKVPAVLPKIHGAETKIDAAEVKIAIAQRKNDAASRLNFLLTPFLPFSSYFFASFGKLRNRQIPTPAVLQEHQ